MVEPARLEEHGLDQTSKMRSDGFVRDRYRPSTRPRWTTLIVILLLHGAAFMLVRHSGEAGPRREPERPLTIELLPLTPPPRVTEPRPAALQPVVKRSIPISERKVAVRVLGFNSEAPTSSEAPIVHLEPAPPGPALTTSPIRTLPIADEATETAAPQMLPSRLRSAEPPRYPIESRRRRESGVVVLLVAVDVNGEVAEISLASSSGVDRLDDAALVAVRRWRWFPRVVDGRPTAIRGLVRIPFTLTSK